jgi:predicted DNA-binding WGR domain protein
MTQNLVLAVSLDYVDTSSNANKEYHLVLRGDQIVARYGRRDRAGNYTYDTLDTPAAAAGKFWSILRAKTGKGYRVAYATTTTAEDIGIAFEGHGERLTWRELCRLANVWHTVYTVRMDAGFRTIEADQPSLDTSAPTPRTARQGSAIILALTDPHCGEATLLQCALATNAERFLWGLATTHPNAPDTVKVARALTSLNA